jgi:hypothetical protein
MKHGVAAVVLVLATYACRPHESPPPPAPAMEFASSDPVSTPGSGEPNLTVTADGRILLSWIEPAAEKRHALRYAVRAPGTAAWSEPRTIAEGADWFVNWADFPSLAALADGTLFAHWLVKSGPGAYSYDVNVSRSLDGQSWTPPVVVHRDGVKTEHGFVSMTPWAPDTMGLVWLDGRAMGAASGHGQHAGAMTLVQSTMRGDGTLGPETTVDSRVCDCCQTDIARTGAGPVVVYRDRSEKEVRDIYVVRYVDGAWSAPRPIAADGWEIAGCPVNGPAVAARGTRVAAAWFTAAGGTARVKVALSMDSGATFGTPVVVDDGSPVGRVDVVMLDDDSALVSWVEGGRTSTLRVRRIAKDGQRDESQTVAGTTAVRSSGFPRMVHSKGEVVMAWRDSAEPPRIRAAVLRLP